MKTVKKATLFLISGLLVIGTQTGCEKEKDESPALPPQSSMNMNLEFANTEKSGQATSLNYGIAALNVGFWSVVAAVHSAIPSAAFNKAFEYKPTWDNDAKVWVWTYTTPVGLDSYEAKLTGKIENDSVKWQMYLSKNGINPLQDILWFEGKSHYGRTGGWWVLNYPVQEGIAVKIEPSIKIDWTYINSKELSLRYTYIAGQKLVNNVWQDNDDKGNYIEYGREIDPKYDAYYLLFSKKDNKKYNIFWNIETREGKIELEGGDSGCWDTNLQDKACE